MFSEAQSLHELETGTIPPGFVDGLDLGCGDLWQVNSLSLPTLCVGMQGTFRELNEMK